MILAIHGGAGLSRKNSLTPEREAACRAGLLAALDAGWRVLEAGGSSLDAVEASVVRLEDDPLFNAGRGAVLGADGTIEHDASVMDGRDRRAGAIAGVRTVRNPVRLARAVMEHTPHVLLIGAGAEQFAGERKLERADPSWFVTSDRVEQLRAAKAEEARKPDVYGTVGAVAADRHGHVAAATSTGGTVNKRPGRVGDSPVIGAGTFAWDRTCAVSGTGHGEPFVRLGVAGRVSAWMEMGGLDLVAAAERTIADLSPLDGEGGLIAIDSAGHLALPFNTGGMFRAWRRNGGEPEAAIW